MFLSHFSKIHKITENLTSEQVEHAQVHCELEWVKIKIKGNRDFHIGVFYMPHRIVHDIEELDRSLNLVTENKARQVVLVGDFNCPGLTGPRCLYRPPQINLYIRH